MGARGWQAAAPDLDDVRTQVALSRMLARTFGRNDVPLIGRYRLRRRLGSGGTGDVWTADDPELGREVAIKLLRPIDPRRGDTAEALRREARALARLADPHIVTVYEVGEHEGRVFLAMEHVPGPTLADWLATPRTWPELRARLDEMARGLAAAHAAGIVHRDIKPANAVLARDGTVKLVDFGLAYEAEPASTDPDLCEDDEGAERTSIAGTLAFMAPEQLRGERPTAATDQFALCVVAWEAITGQHAFTGRDPTSRLAAIAHGPRDAARSIRVPTRVLSVLRRGLQLAPTDRWPSIEALALELRRAGRVRWTAAVLGLAGNGLVAASIGGAPAAVDCDARGEALAQRSLGELDPKSGAFDRNLHSWTDEWLTAWHASCEEPDARRAELASACLDELIVGAAALHAWRLEGSLDPLDAVTAVGKLAAPAMCEGSEDGSLDHPPAHERPAYEDGRRRYAELRALILAARNEPARQLAQELLLATEHLTAPALRADLHIAAGMLAMRAGQPDEAVAHYEHARQDAEVAGHVRASLRAASLLVHVYGRELGDAARAEHWARETEASLARFADPPPDLLALVENSKAQALAGQRDFAGAVAHQQRAWELLDEAGTPLDASNSRMNLAVLLAHTGAGAEALAHADASAARHIEIFGAGHPSLSWTFDNLGAVRAMAGEYEAATLAFADAFAIASRAHGPLHPDVATSMHNLGTVALDRGDRLLARMWLGQALAIRRMAFAPGDPHRIETLEGLDAALDRDDPSSIRRELVDELEAAPVPPPARIVTALVELARAEQARGHATAVATVLRRASAWADDPAVSEAQRSELRALARPE